MTAPAMLETPAVPASTSQDDAMEATIKATLGQAVETEANEPTRALPGRDPVTGKFTNDPDAHAAQPVAGAPGVDATVATDEPPPVVIPDGYVAVESLPEDRVKGFKVRDAEGEIAVPNLTWDFTANGKPRSVDTATLLQYAQHGVYNHEREQARVQTEQQNQQVVNYARRLEQQVQTSQSDREKLLSDPDYLIRELTRYEQENTPEARQEKERQKLEQDKQSWQLQQMAQQSETYISGTLEPAIETMIAALPTVSKEEIAAKLFVVADRYRVNGVLHPNGYDPIGKALVNDILPWAQQLHAHRLAERQTPVTDAKVAEAKAKADADAAKVRAQKARRQGTTPLKPGGQHTPGSPTPKPIRNAKDAEDAVIGNSLAAMRAG